MEQAIPDKEPRSQAERPEPESRPAGRDARAAAEEPARAQPDPAQQSPAPQARPSATLLVVDDNDLNREVLTRFFELRGYTVLGAEDGVQALEMVKNQPVDLVLLDIMMPDVSGIDVLKSLRQMHSRAELPVIMVTAKDQTEDVVEALTLGANDYIVKPLDFPVVLARAETQLSLKQAMAEITRLARKLEIRNRFIQSTFGRYLSDEIVTSILETPGGLRLGGEKRTVSLLMSDLRGFTALAERLSPEHVVRLLNNYLGGMADVITRYQGIIDEFVGDAIMALFGAPADREDDAERAAACAVAMQLAMADVNEKNRRDGLPEVEMGVAINTGEVIVGNIGSETRAKYGVVGTNVNLTSRIQSFTLGGQILISQATFSRAGDTLKVGEPITLRPKGLQGPIVVRDLLGVAGRHNIHLSPQADVLQPLRREIPITFSVLHGLHSYGAERQGRLLKASERGALVQAARTVAPLSDLRIRARTLQRAEEVPGEIYAKVVECEDAGRGRFCIRFTSQAPQIARLIQESLGPGPEAA